MNPDTISRLLIATMLLIVVATWLGFSWQAFAQSFPVTR